VIYSPAGHREGHEWRCGSIAGEPGNSLGVHLTGSKAGVWSDFSAGQKGDALDLVRAALGLDMPAALRWSCRWLGIEEGEARLPSRPPAKPPRASAKPTSDFWFKAWNAASPITGTRAETYLRARGLQLDDPEGRVLRFAERHARRNAVGDIEHHPALVALLCDIHTGEPAGTINVCLKPDGADRLRDPKGKTSWGRAGGSVVMLSAFDEPTLGLTIC